MADSSGLTQVLEKYTTFSPNSLKKRAVWIKVKRFETLKSLKQRLQAKSDVRINLEPKTSSAEANAPVLKCQTQPAPSELSDNGPQPALQIRGPGGSTKCQPLTAGPSATTSSNVAIENMEKPGTEIAMDSTVGPVSNDDAENVKVKREEGPTADVTYAVSSGYTVPAASCPAPSATAFTHKEHFAELPQIDEDIFKALTAAVRQHRLTRGSRPQREKRSQDDFTDDTLSSDAYLFEDPDFNMDDFVTVDEVGDDMEDTIPESHSSSSPSRVRGERQSSGVLSGGKQSSTRSPKESKSSASSSFKSTKGSSTSHSSSASTKKSIYSSEPISSPIKPSSSASMSKPSSSFPLSTQTPSSPSQKAQESKTKSPLKASNTPSSHYSTRSSSSACEKERITSATTAKASIETHLELQREGTKAIESAGSKSDYKVSAEDIAAKTIETKIETSEIQSPPQGHGVELSQAKLETSKEVQKEDDVEKHTEEEEDDEVFQILDSVEDQTDNLTDEDQDGTPKSLFTVPDEGHSLDEESYQVLDSVNDEGKTCPKEHNNMEIDSSVQVLDSISEDETATSQEDNELVTVKQMSEEDIIPAVDESGYKFAIKDAEGKGQQSNKDNFRLYIGSKQAPMGEEDEKKTNQNEVLGKFGQIPSEDAALQDCDNKDSLKDPDSDSHEQEFFEILDSVDEQTATEDDDQKQQPETPSDQICQDYLRHMEDEEDAYQVIDSVEDQPTTTETKSETIKKEQRTKKGEATARKGDRPSTRSRLTTTASKTEEKEKSPKKQDRTVRKYETRTKMDTNAGVSKKDKEINEEMVFEILDSVEDKPVEDPCTTERSGRRRSARGKKEDKTPLNLTEVSQKPVRDEEATYEILDSVEEETADVGPTIATRSTRGRRERTNLKDASNEKTKKENTPTRRQHTPARDSQERNRAKTPKKEDDPPKESTPPKESILTKKSDVVAREVNEKDGTHKDSVEVKDNCPTTGGKGKRGRPKKEVPTAKKDHVILKKSESETLEKVADEDEANYQILDSVEDDTVDDHPLTGQMESSRKENISKNDDEQTESSASPAGLSKNEEDEEEPMYQIIDSVEDDQEEPTATEVSDTGREKRNSTKEDALAEKEDTQTCESTVIEESKKEVVMEESSTTTPEEEKKQKSPEKKNTANTLANLDEVSEDEEDYPDDTAEEEELRKKQATSKKKLQEREARRSMERGQQSRSSSGGIRGGSDRERTWRARENEEKVEISKQLVTLDKVEPDKAEEERGPESREWDRGIMEGELQTLVTLDEFIEEDEDGKSEQSMLKAHRNSQEDESLDSLNPETLMTIDEACGDEEEKRSEEQPEKTSKSAKRKHDDDTEESMNFVTVDEVGEVDDEEKEAATLRTKGRAQKRNRQTPVRKSTRGKKVNANDKRADEKEQTDVLPPASLNASSSLSAESQPEVQRTDVEAESEADDDAHSAGQELQSEDPENQTLEKCVEEQQSRGDVVSKHRGDLVGPEAKRSRSQSPCVAADFKLPAFKPNNPLGQEFVVPKSGYFCNLCSLFYLTESTAKNRHCSSQRHYDNLQKHYQKLGQKPSRSSTQSSQGSISD